MAADAPSLRIKSRTGRWTLAVTILGSGMAFLDGSVVNVALRAIDKDFHTGVSGLEWIVDAYLLTLSALIILGGSLGDRFGRRRIFVFGVLGFAVASLACGLAPNATVLIMARAVQGVAGALLVPGSLALISASFAAEDRGRAIGLWSGLTSGWFAAGPFLGGFLVGAVSWRLVFLINLPLALATVILAIRFVPESSDNARPRLDVGGATAITVGLAGTIYALIEGPAHGWNAISVAAAVIGVTALLGFVIIERSVAEPMLPTWLFRSRQFSAINAVTFVVYAALGVTSFLTVVAVQTELGFSPLQAGAALIPATLMMMTLSSRMGALAQRIGPRVPMSIGPVLIAAGMLLLSRIVPGDTYFANVFPGIAVFGLGLSVTVAPLTAAMLAAVDVAHAGIGSAINNAVARVAGLLAIAVLPALAGLAAVSSGDAAAFAAGYHVAMRIAAGLSLVGAVLAWLLIRRSETADQSAGEARPDPAAGDFD